MKKLSIVLIVLTAGSLVVAGGGYGKFIRYECTEEGSILASYRFGVTRIIINGQFMEMKRTISASGERYKGSGYVWWVKGPNADLYREDAMGNLTSKYYCKQI